MITVEDFEDIVTSDDWQGEAKKCYELALKMVEQVLKEKATTGLVH